MYMSVENTDFGETLSSQSGEAVILDQDFEKKLLIRTIEAAATVLRPDDLKEAVSQGLGNTHLIVVDEPEEPMSALLDSEGKPKRGARSHMTREEIIESLRLTDKQKRVARLLSSLHFTTSSNPSRPDKSEDTL